MLPIWFIKSLNWPNLIFHHKSQTESLCPLDHTVIQLKNLMYPQPLLWTTSKCSCHWEYFSRWNSFKGCIQITALHFSLKPTPFYRSLQKFITSVFEDIVHGSPYLSPPLSKNFFININAFNIQIDDYSNTSASPIIELLSCDDLCLQPAPTTNSHDWIALKLARRLTAYSLLPKYQASPSPITTSHLCSLLFLVLSFTLLVSSLLSQVKFQFCHHNHTLHSLPTLIFLSPHWTCMENPQSWF